MRKKNTIPQAEKLKLYADEITLCQNDFYFFCERYLRVINRDGELVPLRPKPAQKRLIEELEKSPWQIVLKARQLGSSTIIAAYYFWKTLFTPNERTLVLAHTRAAVKNIYRIYKTFYENLPAFLQFDTKTSSANELVFFHGGTIRIDTASSQNVRGSTYTNIHCSEAAFWKDISTAVAAAFQTATGNSHIVLETTANGVNEFFQMWNDSSNGFTKTFLSWLDEPDYTRKKADFEPTTQLLEYASKHKLTPERLNWAAETLAVLCAGNWHTFLQEYAIDAVTCFISSGTRFFNRAFPMSSFEAGYLSYGKKNKYCSYTIGVDTASGSPTGDYSSFTVLDVTDRKNVKIMATYLARITPGQFSQRLFKEYLKWDATVVVENNSYGLSIIENMRTYGCSQLYTKIKHDQVTQTFTETFGFATSASTRPILLSRMQEYVNQGWMQITDERLKYEMNTFVYNAVGKPDHSPGAHDDLIFATALALMGIEQAATEVKAIFREEPSNLRERIELELRTGMTIGQLTSRGYFEKKDEGDDLTYLPY